LKADEFWDRFGDLGFRILRMPAILLERVLKFPTEPDEQGRGRLVPAISLLTADRGDEPSPPLGNFKTRSSTLIGFPFLAIGKEKRTCLSLFARFKRMTGWNVMTKTL